MLPLIFLASAMTFSTCRVNETTTKADPLAGIDPAIVVQINELTYTIANEHDQFYSFIGVRALTMVHLTMHDIWNAVDPQYEPYLVDRIAPDVSPEIAAVESVRSILNKAYPARRDTINHTCDAWLASFQSAPHFAESQSFGREVADAYIRHRDNDGHEKNGDYTPMTKPGDYQYTPEFDWVWIPDFSVARPFTLDSIPQFRSPPPPALTSQAYADSYNEVKKFGSKNSTARNPDQTHFAHWWAEFGEHAWNRIGRITTRERGLSAVEANRLFALLNMNLYDLYLVSFDSKYHYDTWRPYTAIRAGETDGNDATAGDPSWETEMLTPPWPEYPSAHAAVGAAGAGIVSRVFGTEAVTFTMESVTALPGDKTRTYHSLDKAAEDCADSRIMNGFHFRFATEEGKRQGRALAKHTLGGFLRAVRKS